MPLERLKNFATALTGFIKNVANDERILSRDKKVILACLALIISPIDIIPDWIPIIGLLDDLVILAIVLDYFFNILDQNILLSHYPWGMKSYTWLKRAARLITGLTPGFVKKWIWQYEPDPYVTNRKLD
jgi:uncharacterized membrane protein YkvA (DUF1232 family)